MKIIALHALDTAQVLYVNTNHIVWFAKDAEDIEPGTLLCLDNLDSVDLTVRETPAEIIAAIATPFYTNGTTPR